MKVLHVIDTSFVGGGQTAVAHLLKGFAGSDVETHLACKGGGPLVDQARAAGAAVHLIPFSKRYSPLRALQLARVVKTCGIDVIHSHGLLATYFAAMARSVFGARVPLVYQQHGFHHHNHGWLTRDARKRSERALCAHADLVVAASTSDLTLLTTGGYGPPERLRLVRYGIPVPEVESRTSENASAAIAAAGRPVVGLVARLHPQKGVDTFLLAAARIRRVRPDVVFAIVGTGELEGELRGMAGTLGLNGEVRWISESTPGVAFMPVFTVGVISSRWEGLPLVLLEYMATARPIVATRVEGCLDAVGSGEAELVATDEPDQMAAAILKLLDDPALARRRGSAAFARYREAFTLNVMVARTRDLYAEVLS